MFYLFIYILTLHSPWLGANKKQMEKKEQIEQANMQSILHLMSKH